VTAAVLDPAGDLIVAGRTAFPDFATGGAAQTRFGGGGFDAYVARYARDGRLRWRTYLGGSGGDTITDLKLASSGLIAFTGHTDSPNFPTAHAFQGRSLPAAMSSGEYVGDAIVGLLQPDGRSLAFASYLGAPAQDQGYRVAVNGDGGLTVAGFSGLTFHERRNMRPTPGAFGVPGSTSFVARISPTWRLSWVATLGDTRAYAGRYDAVLGGLLTLRGLGVDRAGDVFVAGDTNSAWMPTTVDSYQPYRRGVQSGIAAASDFYAARLSADGRYLRWGTYVGGTADDLVRDAVLTADGFTLWGTTYSPDFPRHQATQLCRAGGVSLTDGAVARLSLDGRRLTLGSCLGGTNSELASRITADAAGNLYVLGSTLSADFPQRSAWQSFAGPARKSYYDCFAAKLTRAGALAWASPIGGHGAEYCDHEYGGVAVAAFGHTLVAGGGTTSKDMPGVSAGDRASMTGARALGFVAQVVG
jgi:hypothetical protein